MTGRVQTALLWWERLSWLTSLFACLWAQFLSSGQHWLSPSALCPSPGTPQVPHRLSVLPTGFPVPDQDVAPQHL